MTIIQNKDSKIVKQIRDALKANDFYCPCAIEKTEDTKCLCKNFREVVIEGYCQCGLYYKEK